MRVTNVSCDVGLPNARGVPFDPSVLLEYGNFNGRFLPAVLYW